MPYSTIEKKRCKCGCQKYPTLGYNGYAYSCAPEEIKEKVGSKRDVQRKNKNARMAISAKLRGENRQKDISAGENNLDLWFRLQMASNERICDNCGKSLQHYNEWAWRSSQNHIVDKSPLNGCPSVATHPLNCNVLGMWCCHGQWSTSFENQSKMPCFKKAKEKFQLFKDAIDPDELRKVNPYLLT